MSINICMYINLASKPETQMIGSVNILLNVNRMRRNCRNWEQRWKWRSTVNINAFKPPGSLEPSLQRELKGFTASTALNGCEHELSAKLFSNIPNHNCKPTARLFVLVQHKLIYNRTILLKNLIDQTTRLPLNLNWAVRNIQYAVKLYASSVCLFSKTPKRECSKQLPYLYISLSLV